MARLLRLRQVMELTGISRSLVYTLVGQNKFPKPVRLGEKRLAWLEEEVEQWIEDKVKERDLNNDL